LGLAVGREDIDRRRWVGSAPTALLAGIDPQAPGLGSPASWIEHRNRRVVGEQMVAGKHLLAQSSMQRFEPPAGPADPAGQRRAFQIDAVAGGGLGPPE